MPGCFPTLPVVLDYPRETLRRATNDGDGILLAHQHRARVRRIRLFVPLSRIDELFKAMEMEFPMLEYLYIEISDLALRPYLEIHHTFRAPRHVPITHDLRGPRNTFYYVPSLPVPLPSI